MADVKNATSTAANAAPSNVATDAKATEKEVPAEFVEIPVTVKLRKTIKTGAMRDCVLLANAEVEDMIRAGFEVQDAFENPSKFQRSFIFDAVNAQLKVMCNTAIGEWERLLDKSGRLHKTWTREQCEKELLESRKAKALHDRALVAAELKAKL
jgi:hypothetical protein